MRCIQSLQTDGSLLLTINRTRSSAIETCFHPGIRRSGFPFVGGSYAIREISTDIWKSRRDMPPINSWSDWKRLVESCPGSCSRRCLTRKTALSKWSWRRTADGCRRTSGLSVVSPSLLPVAIWVRFLLCIPGPGSGPRHGRQSLREDGPAFPSRSFRLAGSCRSEEHTSELQSLMRISNAVFCLKKKKIKLTIITNQTNIEIL